MRRKIMCPYLPVLIARRHLRFRACTCSSHAVIAALVAGRKMTGKDVARAIKQYKLDAEKSHPLNV